MRERESRRRRRQDGERSREAGNKRQNRREREKDEWTGRDGGRGEWQRARENRNAKRVGNQGLNVCRRMERRERERKRSRSVNETEEKGCGREMEVGGRKIKE